MTSLRTLPLRDRYAALGARFGEFAGWDMPLWFTGAIDEHMAVRQKAGVFDITHMGRFRLRGAAAASKLGSLFTRDPARLAAGGSAYGFACNDSGGIIDDLIIYRLGDDDYLVICNAANAATVGGLIEGAISGSGVEMAGLREAGTVLLAVQGPAAVDAVGALLTPGVLSIPRRQCREIELGGVSYLFMRTGYTGEDGFEVLVDADAAGAFFDRLIDSGEALPAGLAARDSLRLEAALALHGHDIDETTTPWEAGLSWAVELDHDFRGRDALVEAKDKTTRRLACLVADAPGVIRGHCDVYDGDQVVGTVTSGGHSPMLGKSIALAYLPRRLAREGVSLSVDLRGRRLPAHTVKRPFYSHPE
ncbi:MAG: glycine cleavage system aminomethyltransferase GcvT [Dehalococcoidia bacterium]|nr:glycine cleavage system aminomethyltransferase GcvT [Dehalococcoidia bacterium]